MQLTTPKSLLLVFPLPWSIRRALGSVLDFLVTLSTLCSLLGVLIHFHDFKTPADWLMTQKFISLPGAVPLYPRQLNTPACLSPRASSLNIPGGSLHSHLHLPLESCLMHLSLIQAITKSYWLHHHNIRRIQKCFPIPLPITVLGPTASSPTCGVLMAF